jgi:hypothetical protein
MKMRRERPWLNFYNAADQIVWRLAVSEGVGQTMLREACASGVIRSQREPYDPVTKEGQAPPEFVKPSEWSKDQVDLMTDKDGCSFFVDVDEGDFRYWLDQQKPPPQAQQEPSLPAQQKPSPLLERLLSGPAFRGDINGPWEWEFYGERWFQFDKAANELGDKLAIPPSAAETKLHQLCASGEIRAVGTNDPDLTSEPIPPSQWPEDDLPRMEVLVSNADFYKWLNRQQPIAGGKQSRIARLLAELFPTGVPHRGDCPREQLKAELLKRDPSLAPLDLKTLKTAIDTHNNRQLGNARNV